MKKTITFLRGIMMVLVAVFVLFCGSAFAEEERQEVWETEGNDSIDSATIIDPNVTMNGNLSYEEDVDWYSFTVSAPGDVALILGGSDESAMYTNAWHARIINSDGSEVLKEGSMQTRSRSKLALTLDQACTIYISVDAGTVNSWNFCEFTDATYSFTFYSCDTKPENRNSDSVFAIQDDGDFIGAFNGSLYFKKGNEEVLCGSYTDESGQDVRLLIGKNKDSLRFSSSESDEYGNISWVEDKYIDPEIQRFIGRYGYRYFTVLCGESMPEKEDVRELLDMYFDETESLEESNSENNLESDSANDSEDFKSLVLNRVSSSELLAFIKHLLRPWYPFALLVVLAICLVIALIRVFRYPVGSIFLLLSIAVYAYLWFAVRNGVYYALFVKPTLFTIGGLLLLAIFTIWARTKSFSDGLGYVFVGVFWGLKILALPLIVVLAIYFNGGREENVLMVIIWGLYTVFLTGQLVLCFVEADDLRLPESSDDSSDGYSGYSGYSGGGYYSPSDDDVMDWIAQRSAYNEAHGIGPDDFPPSSDL